MSRSLSWARVGRKVRPSFAGAVCAGAQPGRCRSLAPSPAAVCGRSPPSGG